jgi:hypothetical protein
MIKAQEKIIKTILVKSPTPKNNINKGKSAVAGTERKKSTGKRKS